MIKLFFIFYYFIFIPCNFSYCLESYDPFLSAIDENNIQLVAHFFEKKLDLDAFIKLLSDNDNPRAVLYNPWFRCNTTEMAQLLIQHGMRIFIPDKEINAINEGISPNPDIKYLTYLLEKCPEASRGTAKEIPLELACCEGSTKDLFKLLIDYGADPYMRLDHHNNKKNTLEWLHETKRGDWDGRSIELKNWLQNYYHVRKDLMPLILKNRFKIFRKLLPNEIIDTIIQYAFYGKKVFNGPIYFDPEKWQWYGKVPEKYENYKNHAFLNLTLSKPPESEKNMMNLIKKCPANLLLLASKKASDLFVDSISEASSRDLHETSDVD